MHVSHDLVETSNNIIRIGLLNSRLLGLLLLGWLLLLHHLLLHLHALGHGLLHLCHHWVHRLLLLAHHHRIRTRHHRLLLHHHLLDRISWHLRLLGLIVRITHQIEKINVCSTLLAATCIICVAASVVAIALALLGILRVDMARAEHSLLNRFTRHKLFWRAVLLDSSVSLECLMEVIVYNETHRHDAFIINLTNHVNEFGFELGQCAEEVVERLTLLTWLQLVNDFIGEVDVALNEIHVLH